MSFHNHQKFSSAEACLIALIERDCDVLRARALGEDDEERPVRHRVSPSEETRRKLSEAAKRVRRPPLSEEARARIAVKMIGNTNRKSKSKSATAVPPAQSRRTG